jgi:predicted metal-binding membrane protein
MRPLPAIREYPHAAVGLLAAAALAWWLAVGRMAGMDAGPGTALGTIGWFTGSWVLMMAAMMLPSLSPTLAAYATRAGARGPARWLMFACGYLLVWTGAGLAAYGIFELGKSLFGSDLAWHNAGRWASAGVIAAAAAYEFVPLKEACLERCRGQIGDVQQARGAFQAAALAAGARSGVWCIGCSWALMAALFALGVMSLTWMGLIAALVALEKVGPWPRAARLATAAVLAVLAVGILAAPHDVPGLVVPGSGTMHAMKAME